MKTRFLIRRPLNAVLGGLILLGAGNVAHADSMDELMQSLKNRGVISDADYRRITAEREAEKKQSAAASSQNAASTRSRSAIVFSSDDGANTMQLSGRVQGDYRAYSNKAEPSTFEMRRVLLGVKGKFWNDVKYNVTAHLNNVGANGGLGALEEAWLEPVGSKRATLRVGQFYTPFSLDDANSSKYIDFIERAAIVNQSQSSYDGTDTGVMVYGTPADGYSYWLAYTNGASQSVTNASVAGGRETSIRGVANLAKVFEQKDTVYHLGVDYAWGRKPGTAAAGAELSGIRTEGRSAIFRPMQFTFNGTDYKRTRQDLELAWAPGPFKLQSDIISENYAGTTPAGIGYSKTVRGYYADLMWMITGEKYADSYSDGSFGNTRPYQNFTLGGEGWGAWETGLRFSRLDAGDLNPAIAGVPQNAANHASGMRATTLGLKWIMNPNTRILFNCVHSKYDQPVNGGITGLAPVSSDNAYMMRGQFDF